MKKSILFILGILLCFSSCIDYDYFGLDTTAEIINFDIQGQVYNRVSSEGGPDGGGKIEIGMPTTYDLSNLRVSRVNNTQLSFFDVDPFEVTDFSSRVVFTLTAEDTTVKKKWVVIVDFSDTPSQIAYSSMTEWTQARNFDGNIITYKDNNKNTWDAYFPGSGDESTPWSSTAEANAYSLSYIKTMTVNPYPSWDRPSFARLETIHIKGGTAATVGAQVVTGALFTGNFIFNFSYMSPVTGTKKPRKMVDIGVPFYRKPTAARLKMRYLPGLEMMDGDADPITSPGEENKPLVDSCDIYFILHNREEMPGTYIRVGAAHLRAGGIIGDMSNDNSGFVEVTIPFVYGQPDAATLSEKPYLKPGGTRGELTFYQFAYNEKGKYLPGADPVDEIYASDTGLRPDHISVMFSSSAYGDEFWGAVNGALHQTGKPDPDPRGSTLDVKDIELLYE